MLCHSGAAKFIVLTAKHPSGVNIYYIFVIWLPSDQEVIVLLVKLRKVQTYDNISTTEGGPVGSWIKVSQCEPYANSTTLGHQLFMILRSRKINKFYSESDSKKNMESRKTLKEGKSSDLDSALIE